MTDRRFGRTVISRVGVLVRRAVYVAAAILVLSSGLAPEWLGASPAFAGVARGATTVPWEHKGFSLPVWSEDGLLASGPALEQLAGIGANSVTFVVSWYTLNNLSTDMYRTTSTASDASLIWAIQKARSLGLKANLKLHLESQDGRWRAYIDPVASGLWFANYSALVNHYADLGRQEGLSIIVIGAELISMSANPAYETQWRTLVASARQHFSGKLTYSANWGSGSFAEEYPRINWWDALDYLGISAYFPLASTTSPTVAQMTASWANWKTTKIVPFQLRWGKPVLFTEGGYRSADGTAMQPWNSWDIWPLDTQEQTDCFEAFFQSWSGEPWFAGTMFWAWNTNTNVSPTDIWYEVQNKPALETIKAWFGASSTLPPPSIQIRSPLSNQTYRGMITLQATATNVTGVSYRINENARVPTTFDPAAGVWRADLNTMTLTNGYYNVTVTGQGQNGSAVEDRAWSIRVDNTTPTPTPTPTVTPTPTPTAIPTPTPTPTALSPTIQIGNPQSNQTYGGTINVRATAANVRTVSYRINENAGVAMGFDQVAGLWRGDLNTATLPNGYYNLTVSGAGQNGSVAEDRAWFIQVTNAATTPPPTPTPTAPPTPTATPTPTPTPTATPTIRIVSPQSNQTYSGTISVQATGAYVKSVSFRINENAGVAMSFDQAAGLWRADLNTTTLTNGYYNVTVSGQGQNGSVIEDRAWFIQVRN